MPTLIIPDVHERFDRLMSALYPRIERADRVVFLGDWFDAFGPVGLFKVGQMCGFINGNIDGVGVYDGRFVDRSETDQPWDRIIPATFLLGNHDCHYFFRHSGFQCSGYNNLKKDVIDANVTQGIIEQFKISTQVCPYLVSHAGYTEQTLQYRTDAVEAEALKAAYAGKFDPLFGAGHARGGWQPVGGPTWLDWNQEFEHINDCPQIVGHTNGTNVRVKGPNTTHTQYNKDGTVEVHEPGLQSYCLDTALHDIAWVEDDGTVTIEWVN